MLNKLLEFKHSNSSNLFYSCDNDILHDPVFVDKLLYFYNKYKFPVTLSNSTHNKKRLYTENNEAYFQRRFYGTTILFDINHLSSIDDHLLINTLATKNIDWDLHLSALLSKRNIPITCPKISYSDHYPQHGIHGAMSDRGINLTPFLENERFLLSQISY
jgi:hypothetical protein